MMLEKDIIREAVRCEWNKFVKFKKYCGVDAEETKIQRAKWSVLDMLWFTLYDDAYNEEDL